MLKQVKQQLTQERTMKQDAFHQVDELLTQMNNLDMVKANTKIAIATKGESIASLRSSSLRHPVSNPIHSRADSSRCNQQNNDQSQFSCLPEDTSWWQWSVVLYWQ